MSQLTISDQVKILVALVAALGSSFVAVLALAGSVVTAWMNRQAQIKVAQALDAIAGSKSERDALRDYRYEARRRIYKDCEPNFFQLVEACDAALRRIETLPQLCVATREPGEPSWIEESENRLSTLYRLIAPVACHTLVRERLTTFDLTLAPRLYLLFNLSRLAVDTFSHDRSVAACEPRLPYQPGVNPPDMSDTPLAVFAVQGISDSKLDPLASLLVERGERALVIPYSQFMLVAANDLRNDPILNVSYLLNKLSVDNRPVLWRLLAAQATLYRLIVDFSNSPDTSAGWPSLGAALVKACDKAGGTPFDQAAYGAARGFLEGRLKRIEQSLKQRSTA